MNSALDQPMFVDPPPAPAALCDALLPQWLYRERWHATVVSVVLALTVFGADLVTGREFQVVPLYLLPVALATWIAGRTAGLILAGLCAVLWLVADLLSIAGIERSLAPYSNAAGLLVIFGSMAWMVARLHAAMHSLEATVQRRTSALLAEMSRRHQAEEARVRAERLAVVGTMSAQLAHEVRNPLGAIKLNVDLLSQEITSLARTSKHPVEESETLLAQFRQEVQRIKQIVDGYMGLVRQPHLVFGSMQVNDYLAKQLRIVKGELAASNVQLVEDYDPRAGFIETDGPKLWEAMMNLVTNARQAMAHGGRLTVSTEKSAAEIHIAMSDTGCGIPAAGMERLFTPFFTTKMDGTGLGLVLVHQIVTDLGGRISCQSEPGQGTTFVITLPIRLSRGTDKPLARLFSV